MIISTIHCDVKRSLAGRNEDDVFVGRMVAGRIPSFLRLEEEGNAMRAGIHGGRHRLLLETLFCWRLVCNGGGIER